MNARTLLRATTLVAAIATAACASAPEEIQATYVSPTQYSHFDCDQIRFEMMRVGGRASDLHGYLAEEASSDTTETVVGVLLFWPTLFFLDGDGAEAHQYARLKGEYDALEQAAIEKKCGFEPQPLALPASKPVETTQDNGARPY